MDDRREIAKVVAISIIGVVVFSGIALVVMLIWGDDPAFHGGLQDWLMRFLKEPQDTRGL